MKTLFKRNENIHRESRAVPGGDMSAVHFGPLEEDVKLVFLHANGFHGLAYRTLLEPLGEHVVALDLRGHGQTNLPIDTQTVSNFHLFAQDVAAYLKAYVPGKVVLGGHSLGASTAILTASKAPDIIKQVVAFDPPAFPSYVHWMLRFKWVRKHMQKSLPIARTAGKRRSRFDSYEAAFKRYHGRKPFSDFSDEALWDYVTGGFKQDDQGVYLACPPEWERSVYTAHAHNLRSAIRRLPVGSIVMQTDAISPGNWLVGAQKKRPELRLEFHPGLDHFFPLVDLDMSIAVLREVL